MSEVMLQQTTVAVGTDRYAAFLERFPTVAAMAAASERDVLAAWSGLGYYERARNLWRGARAAAALGGIPRDAAGLARLPGIGPYTAAAIASIAYGESAAAVDGNVLRVLSRLLARPWSTTSAADAREARHVADALLDRRHPADHNQALMELGALVCTPRAPRCGECPVRRLCAARRLGSPEGFPVKPVRRAPRRVRLVGGIAWRRGRLVLVPDDAFVPGHLVVPLFPLEPGEEEAEALARLWPGRTGREVKALSRLGRLPHSVLERRYDAVLFEVTEGGASGRAAPALLSPRQILAAPRGGFLEKALRLATGAPSGRGRRAAARRRPSGG